MTSPICLPIPSPYDLLLFYKSLLGKGQAALVLQTSKVRSVTSPTSGWSSKAPDSNLDLSDDSEERDNPEELYAQGIIDAVELQRLKNRAAQRRCAPPRSLLHSEHQHNKILHGGQ